MTETIPDKRNLHHCPKQLINETTLGSGFIYMDNSRKNEKLDPQTVDSIQDTPKALKVIFQLMYEKIKDADEKYKSATFMKIDHQLKLSFEIGYIVVEIQDKYKRMLTLYHRYLRSNNRGWLPLTSFTCYEQIEHLHQAIIHLCNMEHELAKKYKNIVDGKFSMNWDRDMLAAASELERNKELKRLKEKHEQRMLKKQMKKGNFSAYNMTTTKKKRYYFPIEYGWEIQDW